MRAYSVLQLPLALIVVTLALTLSACGSSSGSGSQTNARPASTSSATDGAPTTTQASSKGNDCPLTEAQVSQAIGATVPLTDETPTSSSICTFATMTSAGIDLSEPGVTVMPFPMEGQTTLAALRSELSGFGEEINDRPEWGNDAFFTIEENSATSIEVFVGDTHVLVFAPLGSVADPRAAAETLGGAISGR
jgi:hypothetical protein